MRSTLLWPLFGILAVLSGCEPTPLVVGGDLGHLTPPSDGNAPDLGDPGESFCPNGCPSGFVCSDGVCAGGPLDALVLDEEIYPVSGTVTVDGAAPALADVACHGPDAYLVELSFFGTHTGYAPRLLLDCTAPDYAWSIRLPADTYQVVLYGDGHVIPELSYVAEAALVVDGPRDGVILDEKLGHQVSGALLVNGASPTLTSGCATGQELATIELTEQVRGHAVTWRFHCGDDFAFSQRLPAGTYDVVVTSPGGGALGLNLAPGDYHLPPLTVSGTLDHVILDAKDLAIGGKLTVDGKRPHLDHAECTGNEKDASFLELADTTTGLTVETAVPCTTTDFSWSAHVVPGTYRVTAFRSPEVPSVGLPIDAYAFDDLVVTASRNDIVLDARGYEVSGTIVIDGETLTPGACSPGAAGGRLELVEKQKGHEATVALPCGSASLPWSLRLPAGTYEARVKELAGTTSKGGQLAKRPLRSKAPLVVTGPTTGIVLDVAARTVRGTITKNGKPPTKNAAKCLPGLGVALVTFYELTDLSNAYGAAVLCDNDDFSWSVDLPEGAYRVRVSGTSASDLIDATVLPSFAVTSDVADLVLDEVTYRVAGAVRVNGAMPDRNSTVSCTPGGVLLSLYFEDRVSGIIESTDLPCTTTDFSFAIDLPRGVYDITVEPTGGTAVFGVNVLDWGFTALTLIAVP